ncbi:iron-sulfur cluster assembly scaffold protein [Pelagibacteraceae bacterium]|nr:iron-sulfur cluster assembly scaffold protein [Pelagibacteraceae bacterium]
MIDKDIINIASNNNNFGLKNNSTHKANCKNTQCGDMIKIELIVKKKKIKKMRYETESCVFCEASASLLSNLITRFSIDELKKDSNYLKDIIKKKKIIIPTRFKIFKDIIKDQNINRINCIMLPFNALFKALKI